MNKFQDARTWAMMLHLSLLAGYTVAPVAGLVAPILIWQLKREEMPELDEHGKIVVNWLLSSLIYGAIGFILTFFIIGFVVLIGLYVAGLIFPIVGAIKANSGETWNYPLTIRFV